MNLSEIKGHEKIKKELEKYASSEKVPHSFLFYGISGIGKFSCALAFASLLNCEKKDPACPGCPSCSKISSLNHPDIHIIGLEEGKTSIAIDQVRDLILKMKYAPLLSKYKVTIIDQAELLNIHSTNALLKTLEEPPANAILIIVTSNIRTIKPTIISRCNLVKFSPLEDAIIRESLKTRVKENTDIDLVSKIAEGSLGKAISVSEGKYGEIKGLIAGWLAKSGSIDSDPIEISELLNDRYSDSLEEVFDVLLLVYRDLLAIKQNLPPEKIFNPEISSLLKKTAQDSSMRNLLAGAQLIYLTRGKIFHNNANSKIAMDDLFLRLSYGNN